MTEQIECRTCGDLFDPNERFHKERGYVDQCGDCAIEAGDDNIRVKAFTGFDSDSGDWQGIEIVSNDEYEKYRQVEEQYGGEKSKRIK